MAAVLRRFWKSLSRAEMDGKFARKLGLKRTMNPYGRRGFSVNLRRAWDTGWVEFDREMKLEAYLKLPR